ncbi:hypothetical protein SKAU_G00424980 [Synaphobranchus kaupii]|uniref:Uncharacterized protein n=1 Tax=Synaphobranchus kaupii TaxID=118154 RepID=A0A9Q1E5R0_SYNKA|nr:hypothetical protein SKAU_G00424980 [Synaphobranchus kaupii]
MIKVWTGLRTRKIVVRRLRALAVKEKRPQQRHPRECHASLHANVDMQAPQPPPLLKGPSLPPASELTGTSTDKRGCGLSARYADESASANSLAAFSTAVPLDLPFLLGETVWREELRAPHSRAVLIPGSGCRDQQSEEKDPLLRAQQDVTRPGVFYFVLSARE